MKKLITGILILSAFCIVFANPAIAKKKNFKGTISYKISYDEGSIDENMKSMLPKLLKASFRGGLVKTEIISGMGKQVEILNTKEKTTTSLLDIMGQKFSIKTSAQEIQDEISKAPKTQIIYTDETKEIAGYVCKKVIVKFKEKDSDTETEVIAYLAEDFSNEGVYLDNPVFNGIKGILLEFEINADEISMKFIATSVNKKNIPEKEFAVPEDFKETTKDELQEMFGG
jgi:GLPGLI family protein